MSRILIIEDCDDYRWMLKAVLEKAGYEVLDASNVLSGLDITRTSFINLVITDLYMPEIDGIQAIIRFKQEFPGIKIIAMTGACSNGRCDCIFKLAKEHGAIDVHNKDDIMSNLLAKIRSVI